MKKITCFGILLFLVCLLLTSVPSSAKGGKGYMGGAGSIVVEEDPPTDTGGTGGMPGDVEGPLNDKMSDSGKLFGDLYRLLRQQGTLGDQKLMPAVNETGEPVLTTGINVFNYTIDGVDYTYDPGIQLFTLTGNTAESPDNVIGGEPVLTVIDPGQTNTRVDYGWYAAEIGILSDETPVYGAARSPYPAQCVQPVANYERWGDISSKTGLTKNRLPMVITYDATWNRSECAVNQLLEQPTADPSTGELIFNVNPYFIEPCDIDPSTLEPIPADKCQWEDPTNGVVTYPNGVLWADLIQEVGFGRLNISRSPEAVLQSAFDEAINNINSPDTIAIEIDAAGRLFLTKNVYSELEVDPDTGAPILEGTIKKAVDSPLENVALYVKLMQDGHLVTPGDEREPIDRSKFGGIPLWKMLELEDGPADAALRPTVDIAKLQNWGLGSLVDVSESVYYTYYQCIDANNSPTECLCWNDDPVQPELEGEWVACEAVADRQLFVVQSCPEGVECEGPFTGLTTDADSVPDSTDLGFAAGFLAAAADKTGEISQDMVVYLNSIMGINKVVGYSEYDADGNPTETAIDYEKNPVYFNFRKVTGYDRNGTFQFRGNVVTEGGDGFASTYDGTVTVLQGASPSWTETTLPILAAEMDKNSDGFPETIFDNLGMDGNNFPNGDPASENIMGFTQLSDDDLGVIFFIHTFQIPGLR